MSFLTKGASIKHTHGIHKTTAAFLAIQTVAGEVDNTAREENSPVPDRTTKTKTYKQASMDSGVQKLSAAARKAITGHDRPGELEAISEDPAGDPSQNPAVGPPPKLSPEERNTDIVQGKRPAKEKQQPSEAPSLEPAELADPASGLGMAPPPPPPTTTTVAAQDETEVTERSVILAPRPLPTSWGEGAPPNADMADKEVRPAAEPEVTPKKQKLTESKRTTGAQSA